MTERHAPQLGDTVTFPSKLLFSDHPLRDGKVIAVADDGWITAEFPNEPGSPPMKLTSLPEHFVVVHTFDLPGGESMLATLRDARQMLEQANQKLDSARDERNLLEAERDQARAELASARQEIKRLRAARQWIVARDAGYTCQACEQPIRRGEAYELLGGVDEYRHIRCPHPRT